MYACSDEFKAQVKKSHRAVTKCEVWSGTNYQRDLDIIEGNVHVDDVAFHRTCEVSLTDSDGTLTPVDATSLLNPVTGNELRLYRGIVLPSTGLPELIPQGVFGVTDLTIDDSGEGYHMRLQGSDRARRVSRAKMTTSYVIATGTNYKTAITALVQSRFGSVTFSDAYNAYTTTLVTPQIVLTTGDDPWSKAQKMAMEGLGADLYFDVLGSLTIVPVTDPSTSPSMWDYVEGVEATLLYINRTVTDQDTFNHIVVFAEHPDNSPPIRGEAKDTNPSSPTYYLGPYGDVVDVLNSNLITTQAQADIAAAARLNKTLGVTDLVRFNAIVNPCHEIGDIITISRNKLKVNAAFVVDKITVPMVIDRPMDIATRKRKL